MIVNYPFNGAPGTEGFFIPFNAMDDVMLQHLSYNWMFRSRTDTENWNLKPLVMHVTRLLLFF